MSSITIKPNSGAAVTDIVAAGNDYELQAEWLKKNNIDASNRITLKKLSHVRYQHPDLQEITSFLAGTLPTSDN